LRIFIPVYLVVASIMVLGVYFFVTSEDTALATVPPASDVEIFVPLTPTPFPTPEPTPTPKPIDTITWDGGVGELMQTKCGTCHNDSGMLGGLDLTSYSAALAGGNSGSGFVPGDSVNSLIVIRQEAGDHPGQLSAEELELLREWIDSGAPEN
jgi:hypothetical protein